jgi:hypothetical protein
MQSNEQPVPADWLQTSIGIGLWIRSKHIEKAPIKSIGSQPFLVPWHVIVSMWNVLSRKPYTLNDSCKRHPLYLLREQKGLSAHRLYRQGIYNAGGVTSHSEGSKPRSTRATRYPICATWRLTVCEITWILCDLIRRGFSLCLNGAGWVLHHLAKLNEKSCDAIYFKGDF